MKVITVTKYDEAVPASMWQSQALLSVNEYNEPIVDFGNHARYYIQDLLAGIDATTKICIDASGRNHKGYSVWVSMTVELKEALKSFYTENKAEITA